MTRPFKEALATPQYGLFCNLGSAIAVEALAHSGFGFLIIDGEHAPLSLPLVHAQLMALAASPTAAVVRVPSNDIVAIKQCLDLGPDGLMVPMIDTADQARAAVRHARYPQAGVRGIHSVTRATRYGRDKSYIHEAASRCALILQVESPTGLANLESICAVDGVDAIFFGPADYSANAGLIGQPCHPDVQAAMEEGVRRVRACGRIAGLMTHEAAAPKFVEAGATLLAVGMDTGLLVAGADGLASRLKAPAQPPM